MLALKCEYLEGLAKKGENSSKKLQKKSLVNFLMAQTSQLSHHPLLYYYIYIVTKFVYLSRYLLVDTILDNDTPVTINIVSFIVVFVLWSCFFLFGIEAMEGDGGGSMPDARRWTARA